MQKNGTGMPNRHNAADGPCMAVALVCDHKLALPAGALAARIADLWQVDVHIFVERPDSQRDPITETTASRVHYHYEELFGAEMAGLLPDHPRYSRAAWGRLFVPRVLRSYQRVLYCDIDILPGPLPEGLCRIALPAGIAMVRDSYLLRPWVWRRPPEQQFPGLLPGVKDYFNSGVILYDPAVYDEGAVIDGLRDFMANEGRTASFPDQDFINLFFAGKVTELSPNMNFQQPLMGLGLIDEDRLAIRHYCHNEKPFHILPRHGVSRLVQQAAREYATMLSEAGLPPPRLPPYQKIRRFKQIKAALRLALANLGHPSAKQRELTEDWHQRRKIAIAALRDAIATERFADPNVFDPFAPPPTPGFDGVDVIAKG